MGEKNLPVYLTFEQVREEFNVDWSKRTLERRIKEDGFPIMKDGYTILHPRERVKEFFKRREK